MNKFYSNKILILLITIFFWLTFMAIFTYYQTESERVIQMQKCLKDLQIPCRWSPDLSNKYGSPFFNYHPPLPYYFGGILYLLSGNLLISTLIFPIIFLFCLLAFWKFYSFEKGINIKNMLIFSIFLTILFLSHSLLTIIFLGLFFTWVIFKYLFSKKKKLVLFASSSLGIALGLSAFYLIPSILERDLVYLDSSLDYLPKSATDVPLEVAQGPYQILTGDSFIFNFNQGSDYFNFKTITKTHTIIRLSQHYFPEWRIFIDGKPSEFEYKYNSLGLMTIILGEGEHKIEGKLFDTPVRIISNMITLTTIVFMLLVYFYQKDVVKRWIKYYRKGIS